MAISSLNSNTNVGAVQTQPAEVTSTRTQVSTGTLEREQTGFATADKLESSTGSVKAGNVGMASVDDNVSKQFKLSPELQATADKVAADVKYTCETGDTSKFGAIKNNFAEVCSGLLANGSITGNSMDADINAIIQQVLRESYMDTNQDLKYYAAKVKSFNEQKKCTRSYLQEMRAFKTEVMQNVKDASNNPDDVKQYIADHTKAAPGATAEKYIDIQVIRTVDKAVVDQIATKVSVAQKLENADKLIYDTFGTNLPDQIKTKLEAAFLSKDEGAKKAVFTEIAAYITYLSDSACENGKFPGYGNYGSQNHMYDDFKHLNGTTTPSYEDFRYCMYDSTDPQNIRSRGNLNPGDIDLINQGFGFTGDQKISRSTPAEQVIAHAMKDINDAWRNQIEVGIKQNTNEIDNDINTKDADSEWVKMYPDVIKEHTEEKEATRYTGSEMATMLGLGGSIPPEGCDSIEKLEDSIKTMEENLSSIGDDAQLANTDLQNVMQKQQQYIQMMSNVSKMVHDTAMAIVRKIG